MVSAWVSCPSLSRQRLRHCNRSRPSMPALTEREIVFQNFYDIGVAVSTECGLMVPGDAQNADEMTFAEIEKKIVELAGLARDNKITTSHLQGGTFTITNGGVFGSMLSTPILNPPDTADSGHAHDSEATRGDNILGRDPAR